MTRTEFRKLYFFSYSLQRTSHGFKKNRKTILIEINQSLLSWEVSQPPPYAQKCQPAPVVSHQEQQEATKMSARSCRVSPGAARSHKNVSPLLSCLTRSSKKPLLIMEASLKIRYFDFNSMVIVSCGIRDK